MTAYDAYRTAAQLATHGHDDVDAVTHADMDQAADLANAYRPETGDDRHAVRIALEALTRSL